MASGNTSDINTTRDISTDDGGEGPSLGGAVPSDATPNTESFAGGAAVSTSRQIPQKNFTAEIMSKKGNFQTI